MNVLAENEYRIGLTLSYKELADYGVTYEQLDYSDIGTRRFLWAVTEDIRKNCGYNVSLSGRILIEVMKQGDDRVKIYLTRLSEKNSDDYSLKQLIRNDRFCITAQFSCFEKMLQAASCCETDAQSTLFEKDGKYRLTFYPDEKSREKLISFLCEFSDALSESPVEEARCNEMWKLICTPLAVHQLRAFFSAE